VLRFNADAAAPEIARFAEAMGVEDAAAHAKELARRGGFERLRDFGVLHEDLPRLAEDAAGRAGNRANPRTASPAEIQELYESIW
jgi:alcohol dehydrogenase class IV